MMSGHATIDTAVRATKLGALDFLEKPLSTDRLLVVLENTLRLVRAEEEAAELRVETGFFDELIGESRAMRELRDNVSRAAKANASVLITGERGTGKELVARAIHRASPRARGPYEKLNCAAVPAELIESELFGHEAGAFTGATKQRRGEVRARPRRHPVPGRGRGHAPRDAGEALARAAGARARARGRERGDQGRRARRGRDEPRLDRRLPKVGVPARICTTG